MVWSLVYAKVKNLLGSTEFVDWTVISKTKLGALVKIFKGGNDALEMQSVTNELLMMGPGL